jgi:thymidylate kinase
MLDKQYDEQLTAPARELISQAIRSIHMEKVIVPALSEYDYIVQDRGILSGLAYGSACGNTIQNLAFLSRFVTQSSMLHLNDNVYDSIIYLKGNTSAGLKKALQAKQEFAAGDAIEAKGDSFMQTVASNMDEMSKSFNTSTVLVDNKEIPEVFSEILRALNIKD